jgi:hypothetical protein
MWVNRTGPNMIPPYLVCHGANEKFIPENR